MPELQIPSHCLSRKEVLSAACRGDTHSYSVFLLKQRGSHFRHYCPRADIPSASQAHSGPSSGNSENYKGV